jgi:hypothetical protein
MEKTEFSILYYMKENIRKEFDRVKAEAAKVFGTSDLTFQEYPMADGWGLEIRLCVMAGNRVFDLIHGVRRVLNNGCCINQYGDRYSSDVDDMFILMNIDYQHTLTEYRIYMMNETMHALDAL